MRQARSPPFRDDTGDTVLLINGGRERSREATDRKLRMDLKPFKTHDIVGPSSFHRILRQMAKIESLPLRQIPQNEVVPPHQLNKRPARARSVGDQSGAHFLGSSISLFCEPDLFWTATQSKTCFFVSCRLDPDRCVQN